ncbi:MAG: serine/threonine protein kinase [Kofleriaceae bacterium]|nr:serine/threonine protein kinase [Kofleriaceae bacterium]
MIERPIGGGGMGTVYRAHHSKVRRQFAVKILHKSLMENPKIVKRFEREAELAGRLRHTNVVSVVDVGLTYNGLRYMAMEFAPGTTLSTILDEGPMSEARMLDLAKQLCTGLQHAHDVGLVHRDFKPDNVIIEQSTGGREIARIVDFGVAILREDAGDLEARDRLTTKGIVVGTPHYMAPEQARGDTFDHRIDIFALGLICYEMLTGVLPFEGSGVEVARANLSHATPAMGVRAPEVKVDPVLEAIVRQMLEKDPDARPPSANFVKEMLALYESDPVSAAALVGVSFDRGPERVDENEGGVEQAPIEESGPASRAATDNDDAIVTRAHSPSQNGNATAELEPSNEVVDERRMITDEVAPPSSRRRMAAVAAFFGIALALILWLGTRERPQHAATIDLDAGGETIATREQAIQPDVPSPGPTTVVVAPTDAGGLAITAKPVKPAQPIVAKTRLDAGVKEIPTAADVAKLYAVVGRELSALEATKGMEATIDLWPRYRWIRINEWITTPERRSHVSALLERLRLDIKGP